MFFILNCLKEFEGIVGLDFLKEVNAKINLEKNIIEYEGGKEALQFAEFKDVNFVKVDDKDVPMVIKNSFKKMIKLRSIAFADPNESLPCTQRNFVTQMCHAHSNALKRPKPVAPAIFMLNTKCISEMYWSRQYLSIDPKKVCHAHCNVHNG